MRVGTAGVAPESLKSVNSTLALTKESDFPSFNGAALRQQEPRREVLELQFLDPQGHRLVAELVEGGEHHLELEFVLLVVLPHQAPQIESGQRPAFLLRDLPEAVCPPRQAARLRDRAAARLHVSVLFARKDDRQCRFRPSVEHRLRRRGIVLGLRRGRFRWDRHWAARASRSNRRDSQRSAQSPTSPVQRERLSKSPAAFHGLSNREKTRTVPSACRPSSKPNGPATRAAIITDSA